MTQNKHHKEYLSTSELAKMVGVSRIAIFKKIQSGKIKAFKIGRNYVVPIEELQTSLIFTQKNFK